MHTVSYTYRQNRIYSIIGTSAAKLEGRRVGLEILPTGRVKGSSGSQVSFAEN